MDIREASWYRLTNDLFLPFDLQSPSFLSEIVKRIGPVENTVSP
jgi:hypothetical protein